MKILEYMGVNRFSPPPVIEPGRSGNILRYCYDQRITKPLQSAPVVLTLAQRNEEKHEANRERILAAIAAGAKVVNTIAERSSVHTGTVFNHIKGLEADGLIAINRDKRPWSMALTKKGKAKVNGNGH